MNINNIVIKFTGGTYIPQELNPDKTQQLVGEVQIYSKEYRDNQDGTHDLIYKAKFIGETNFSEGNGVVTSKDKQSDSKRLRIELMKYHDEIGSKLEFETFKHNLIMSMIHYLPELVDFLREKEK